MPNERNVRTQQMLKSEGLYKGKLDGIIGPQTRKALELHNKAQYQPLPRQRPNPPSAAPSGPPPSGPGLPAGPLSQAPGGQPMPPMPDSSAFINAPDYTYGGPNPASAQGIRDIVNAIGGPETLQPPPTVPATPPNFAGAVDYPPEFNGPAFAPGPQPLDQGALQQAIQTLGQILSSAAGPRR
jgi:hypothetical protein